MKNRKASRLSIILVSILLASTVTARNYYVSTAGNDTLNNGSITLPWKTIAKLNSVQLLPTDSVFFKGGSTYNGTIICMQDSISYASYGVGRAVISSAGKEGFTAENINSLSIDNLEFRGTYKYATWVDGITIYQSDSLNYTGIRINKVKVSNYAGHGIALYAWNAGLQKNISLTNCTAVGCGYNGINLEGAYPRHNLRNVTVTNCISYNNPGGAVNYNHSGSGIFVSCAVKATIDKCKAYGNGWKNAYSGGGPMGIWFGDVDSGTIRNSQSHHNRSNGIDGGGFDFDGGCKVGLIEGCSSYYNEGPGYAVYEWGSVNPFDNITIRNNTSQNDGRKGKDGALNFWTGGGKSISNVSIYGNNFSIDSVGYGIKYLGGYFKSVSVYSNTICVNAPALASNKSTPTTGISVYSNTGCAIVPVAAARSELITTEPVENNIAVSPNPARELVLVKISVERGDYLLKVISADGQLFHQDHIRSGGFPQTLPVSLNRCAPGLYTIVLINSKSDIIDYKKVVKE